MLDQKSVAIFGDSHVGSLKRGLDSLLENDDQIKFVRKVDIKPLGPGGAFTKQFFKKHQSHIEIIEDRLSKNISKLPFDATYHLYGFSGNLHTVRVIRDIKWDKHAPCDLAKDEFPISKSLLYEIFNEDQKYLLCFLEALTSLGIPVFVIEAPKPFRHNTIFSNTRKDVLLFIECAYRKYIAEELSKRSIPVVSIPSSCFDEEGFMLDIFRHENPADNHHANRAFGELMMRRVLKYIGNSDV